MEKTADLLPERPVRPIRPKEEKSYITIFRTIRKRSQSSFYFLRIERFRWSWKMARRSSDTGGHEG